MVFRENDHSSIRSSANLPQPFPRVGYCHSTACPAPSSVNHHHLPAFHWTLDNRDHPSLLKFPVADIFCSCKVSKFFFVFFSAPPCWGDQWLNSMSWGEVGWSSWYLSLSNAKKLFFVKRKKTLNKFYFEIIVGLINSIKTDLISFEVNHFKQVGPLSVVTFYKHQQMRVSPCLFGKINVSCGNPSEPVYIP